MPRWDIWVLLLVAVREVLFPPVASLGPAREVVDATVGSLGAVLGAVLENQS